MPVAIKKSALDKVLYHMKLKYSDLANKSNIQPSLLYKYMKPNKYRCSINKEKSDALLDVLNKNSVTEYKFDEFFYFYDKNGQDIKNNKESEWEILTIKIKKFRVFYLIIKMERLYTLVKHGLPLNKLYTAIKYKQIKHTIVKGTGPTKSKALFLPEYIEEYNHKVFNEGFLGIDYET